MRKYFYTFQLSRLTALAVRSRRTDINLVTFGVLLNRREQGRGTAFTPMWKGTTLRGGEITQGAMNNGRAHSAVYMKKDWTIGPTEVRPDDTVQIVFSALNTGDSELPTPHQQKVDEWVIGSMNVFYSFLLGQFVSGLGLKFVADVMPTIGSAVTAVFTNPVGTLLGIEPSGPCNGLVFLKTLEFTARELDSLDYTVKEDRSFARPVHESMAETAILTETYVGSENHNEEGCGEMARTEVELTVRRYEYWSYIRVHWARGSVLARYPGGGSLKVKAGIRV